MKKILLATLLFCFIVAEDEFFEPTTSIGGYGELHYDMKKTDDFDNEIGKLDFHRFICPISSLSNVFFIAQAKH